MKHNVRFQHKTILLVAMLLMLVVSACAPALATPQAATPTPNIPDTSGEQVFPGLDVDDILVQLDYEPGFVLPEYRYPFGHIPPFTLLADGRVIYIDENQDSKVMVVQLSPEDAAALLQQVIDMGFERLESHTDMCGLDASGQETCIADASTTIMRVRMPSGEVREIKNYANLSKNPATYTAIYDLLSGYASPQAALYQPEGATLFVRPVDQVDQPSPANWPLDAEYIQSAQAASSDVWATALSSEEAQTFIESAGINDGVVFFQHEGQAVQAIFIPWLPGVDFTQEISAEFPSNQ